MSKINIAITDDHPMVLAGLAAILKPFKNIRVINSYATAASMLEGLAQQLPDVLLLDLMLPDLSGKELVTAVLDQYPSLKILVLTSIDIPATVSSVMRRGCKGYLLKGAEPQVLVTAINNVYEGEEYIDESLKRLLLDRMLKYKNTAGQQAQIPELSEREKEILQLIAQEYTTKEISEKLFISYRTAENHRYNLLQKLDVKNTVGLVKAAIQMGLI